MKHTKNKRKPGVDVGDHVYFLHEGSPTYGCVVACGAHGATIDHEGGRSKVYWRDVLGHKQRSRKAYRIIDQGEDGVIAEDDRGRRIFMSGGLPDPDDDEQDQNENMAQLQKAIIMLKAIKDRPGLSLQQTTDKSGHIVRRWKRTSQGDPASERRGSEEARGAKRGYGTHNIESGDTVSFKLGGQEVRGQVVAAGKDGATVRDEQTGQHHRVFWHEISGYEPKDGTQKPEPPEVRGSQERISPDNFSAADYASQHDDPDVTPEDILSHFPSSTIGKIKNVQERLASIEQTIDRYKEDSRYTEERKKLHQEIINHFLSPERVKAATPPEGEQPTFTILGGRGGSGKSWFAGKVYDPDKAIVLDADEIKGMLPEYEGWNAHQVHEESGELFDEITRQAKEAGLNIVHDATMKTASKAVALVKWFKDDGYRVEAHYMHLPRQEAAKRAVARFLGKTNRYVPVEVVLANTTNEQSFDEVKKLADKWSFRDNNVPKGQEPILISESGGGDATEVAEGGQGDILKKSLSSPIVLLWRPK